MFQTVLTLSVMEYVRVVYGMDIVLHYYVLGFNKNWDGVGNKKSDSGMFIQTV